MHTIRSWLRIFCVSNLLFWSLQPAVHTGGRRSSWTTSAQWCPSAPKTGQQRAVLHSTPSSVSRCHPVKRLNFSEILECLTCSKFHLRNCIWHMHGIMVAEVWIWLKNTMDNCICRWRDHNSESWPECLHWRGGEQEFLRGQQEDHFLSCSATVRALLRRIMHPLRCQQMLEVCHRVCLCVIDATTWCEHANIFAFGSNSRPNALTEPAIDFASCKFRYFKKRKRQQARDAMIAAAAMEYEPDTKPLTQSESRPLTSRSVTQVHCKVVVDNVHFL